MFGKHYEAVLHVVKTVKTKNPVYLEICVHEVVLLNNLKVGWLG